MKRRELLLSLGAALALPALRAAPAAPEEPRWRYIRQERIEVPQPNTWLQPLGWMIGVKFGAHGWVSARFTAPLTPEEERGFCTHYWRPEEMPARMRELLVNWERGILVPA